MTKFDEFDVFKQWKVKAVRFLVSTLTTAPLLASKSCPSPEVCQLGDSADIQKQISKLVGGLNLGFKAIFQMASKHSKFKS